MRHIEPIYPPSRHILPQACDDCGGDVHCDKGFADLNAKRGTFLCFSCGCLYGWSAPKRWASMTEEHWKNMARCSDPIPQPAPGLGLAFP